jgi:hypothetical protein
MKKIMNSHWLIGFSESEFGPPSGHRLQLGSSEACVTVCWPPSDHELLATLQALSRLSHLSRLSYSNMFKSKMHQHLKELQRACEAGSRMVHKSASQFPISYKSGIVAWRSQIICILTSIPVTHITNTVPQCHSASDRVSWLQLQARVCVQDFHTWLHRTIGTE